MAALAWPAHESGERIHCPLRTRRILHGAIAAAYCAGVTRVGAIGFAAPPYALSWIREINLQMAATPPNAARVIPQQPRAEGTR